MVKKVVIVGAGPCGVLMAHYLLRRSDQYQIDLYDRLSDPRSIEFSKARTYRITLTERGISALGQIAEIETAVRAISLEIHGGIFHQENGKPRVTSRKKPFVTLDRTRLFITLLQKLTEKYDTSRLNLHFNHACTKVNFAAKTIAFQPTAQTSEAIDTSLTVKYDLLIGADGARSVVRSHFLNTDLFEFEQKYVPTDYKSIILLNSNQPSDIHLEPNRVHSWRSNDGTVVLLLHQPDSSMSGIISFSRVNNQVAALATPEAVLQFFHKKFPEVGKLMTPSEAEAFLQRSSSRVLTTRCSRYHHGDSTLIVGDAAYASVSPSLGQGCNAALEDVAIVDKLLDEYADNWAIAIAQFTIRRKADAHALAELSDNSYPSSAKLGIEFALREKLAKTLHQLFPNYFVPSLMDLVFERDVPYAEILHSYKGWIAKVKKSNQQFLEAS
ncbi:FAD-dependent oxidoreductase [Chlorogloea sp. CCALA 695]|uniref:FAD-dependent oxidoreductase n=1 Tax=Chlorogloea sp. CCALA 695 TaxID=2107693 RepID=UPI000D0742D7|nr:NAD(P)/FAD-dependent oxidoreductase [Chlorogloea sp. CCALA 695]PSB26292.1 FAD-dependent monooxygenase [Chlorogloea sp. CCALA 695]